MKTQYLAYGMFEGDVTDDDLNIFETLEDAQAFALKRMSGPIKRFTEIDGVEDWYLYPETDAFILEIRTVSGDEWPTTVAKWEVELSVDIHGNNSLRRTITFTEKPDSDNEQLKTALRNSLKKALRDAKEN